METFDIWIDTFSPFGFADRVRTPLGPISQFDHMGRVRGQLRVADDSVQLSVFVNQVCVCGPHRSRCVVKVLKMSQHTALSKRL